MRRLRKWLTNTGHGKVTLVAEHSTRERFSSRSNVPITFERTKDVDKEFIYFKTLRSRHNLAAGYSKS